MAIINILKTSAFLLQYIKYYQVNVYANSKRVLITPLNFPMMQYVHRINFTSSTCSMFMQRQEQCITWIVKRYRR